MTRLTTRVWRLAMVPVLMLLLAASDPKQASAASSMLLRSRIRVFGPTVPGSPLTGTLVQVRPDTLVLRANGADQTLPFSAIDSLQRSKGRKSSTLVGGVVGLIMGAGIGAVTGATSDTPGIAVPYGVLVLGGAGLGLGLIIGSLNRHGEERWTRVELDRLPLGVREEPARTPIFGLTIHY
jgi:hypothetical protein